MRTTLIAIGICCQALAAPLYGQNVTAVKSNSGAKPRTVARLLWQDNESNSVRWGDLARSDRLQLTSNSIVGIPKLDKEVCSMVQMEALDGSLIVGVHDHDEGHKFSGWMAIATGVAKEEHGDHYHWRYVANPTVTYSQLDGNQGNPAHVYEYDGRIYIANDKKNGFTIVSKSTKPGVPSSMFHSGGQGHITLAAVNNQVCYATWIDREGENAGRVDVVGIGSSNAKTYSFKLSSGGIHGATANSGRVFFAPTDGICWTQADVNLQGNGNSVRVDHLSLGTDSATGQPLRTGAFANHANWVLCVTGKGQQSTLCIIDAKSAKPSIHKLAINCGEGASLTTPATVAARNGKRYALLFEEKRTGDQAGKLLIVDLDGNGDGNYTDARLAKSIDVGPSKIEGHGGHHEVAFTDSARLAAITNPGDGSIWILSLDSLTIDAKFNVGGEPTRLALIGG